MDVEAVARFVADSTALGADLSGLALRLAALAADAQGLLAAADRMKADRARLDEERRVFEAERASVGQLEAQGRDRVVLDVGGTHFATTRHTLAKVPGSMLAAWFSGRHAVNPRPDGTVFIDRSPALFAYVLDFLRAGVQMQRWRQDEGEEEALRDEFDYFVLPWPKEDPESVVEAFGGELECVEMKGMIADLAWVDLMAHGLWEER